MQKVHWAATRGTKWERGDVAAAAFPLDLLLGYWDKFSVPSELHKSVR